MIMILCQVCLARDVIQNSLRDAAEPVETPVLIPVH